MSNFDRNWHIASFKANNRYCWMKQCTFQDIAWALFSDIKLHTILFCCFSMGSPFESATFGPEFPPIQSSHREGEEEVSQHSANWLSLNWNTRRKRNSFVLGPELKLTHKKRANLCWRRRRWTKSQTEPSWVPSCAMSCFPGALTLNKKTFKIVPNLPNKLT